MTKKPKGISRGRYLNIKDMHDEKLQNNKTQPFKQRYPKIEIKVEFIDGKEVCKVRLVKGNKSSWTLDHETNKKLKGKINILKKNSSKGKRSRIIKGRKPIEPEQADPYDTVPGKLIRKRNK